MEWKNLGPGTGTGLLRLWSIQGQGLAITSAFICGDRRAIGYLPRSPAAAWVLTEIPIPYDRML